MINHLQEFMLELGRDFCFVDRQFRITVGGEHYFLDLLFYHRSLQCLIAIDLKLGKFKHDSEKVAARSESNNPFPIPLQEELALTPK